MALRCDYCHKGRDTGHAVSHAKNRTKRFFKPNIQQLKVMKRGVEARVRLCTRCIKRIKNFGFIGPYRPIRIATATTASTKLSVTKSTAKKETQSLDQLLAKQGITLEEPLKEKSTKAKKTKEKETIKLEDIVGNG